MEVITISGIVVAPSERCKDKNGREYLRFRVSCFSKDYNGYEKYTYYNCYCYFTSYGALHKGDTVFLTGTYIQNLRIPEDPAKKAYVNNDIFVQHLAKGPVATRTTRNDENETVRK